VHDRGELVWWDERLAGVALGAVREVAARFAGQPSGLDVSIDRWATEFGLPRANRSEGNRRHWTDDRIHKELTAFVRSHGPSPLPQTFHQHGARPLLRALQRTGGRAAWVTRIAADADFDR
jgi:hypothetical protein